MNIEWQFSYEKATQVKMRNLRLNVFRSIDLKLAPGFYPDDFLAITKRLGEHIE